MAQKVKKIAASPPVQAPKLPVPKKPIPKQSPPAEDTDLVEVPEVEASDPNEDFEKSLGGNAEKRMPEELNYEKFARQQEKQKRIAEIRKKQLEAFQPEKGWRIIKTVEYDNSDEGFKKSVEKELVFHTKYQPQLEYKIERLPWIGIILRKGDPKSLKGK